MLFRHIAIDLLFEVSAIYTTIYDDISFRSHLIIEFFDNSISFRFGNSNKRITSSALINKLSAIFETSGIGVRKSPFTDSEFQRGQNQRYQRNFWKFFRLWELRDYREYSKKALKFVQRKTNLRALGCFDIILCLRVNGINLVSLGHFCRFFQFAKLKNPVIPTLFGSLQSRFPLLPLAYQICLWCLQVAFEWAYFSLAEVSYCGQKFRLACRWYLL